MTWLVWLAALKDRRILYPFKVSRCRKQNIKCIFQAQTQLKNPRSPGHCWSDDVNTGRDFASSQYFVIVSFVILVIICFNQRYWWGTLRQLPSSAWASGWWKCMVELWITKKLEALACMADQKPAVSCTNFSVCRDPEDRRLCEMLKFQRPNNQWRMTEISISFSKFLGLVTVSHGNGQSQEKPYQVV